MSANVSDYEEALAMAVKLPSEQQQILAQTLLHQSDSATLESVPMVLKRLSPAAQTRLSELMDKNTEGILSLEERQELEALVDEYEQVLLRNTEMLLRASQSDLTKADDLAT